MHAEPLVAARVLGTALALCSVRLASSATALALSNWIRALIVQQCVDAVDLIQEQGSSGIESEWVGGCTYQKETFTFIYGAFESTLALHRGVVKVSQTQRDEVRGHGGGEEGGEKVGGGGEGAHTDLPQHHHVIDRGHPWIQLMFPAICDLLVASAPAPIPPSAPSPVLAAST